MVAEQCCSAEQCLAGRNALCLCAVAKVRREIAGQQALIKQLEMKRGDVMQAAAMDQVHPPVGVQRAAQLCLPSRSVCSCYCKPMCHASHTIVQQVLNALFNTPSSGVWSAD